MLSFWSLKTIILLRNEPLFNYLVFYRRDTKLIEKPFQNLVEKCKMQYYLLKTEDVRKDIELVCDSLLIIQIS